MNSNNPVHLSEFQQIVKCIEYFFLIIVNMPVLILVSNTYNYESFYHNAYFFHTATSSNIFFNVILVFLQSNNHGY